MSGKPGQRRDIETGADRLAVVLLLELKRLVPKRLPMEHIATRLAEAALRTGCVSLREPRKPRTLPPSDPVRCPHPQCWARPHPKAEPHWNGIGRFIIRGNQGRPHYVEQWTTYTRRRVPCDELD